MAELLTITDAPALARFSLRMRTPDAALPGIQHVASFDKGHALGLGPDEWLLLLPPDAAMPVFAGVHACTDVSARSVALHVSGRDAQALLQTGCPLDLARWIPGRVSRTLFEEVEILLWRQGAADFHVEVWRSFAPYLRRALVTAVVDRDGGYRAGASF